MYLEIETQTVIDDLTYEDGGQAAILVIDDEKTPVFVRLQSWIDGGSEADHLELRRFAGKKLRVRIEEVDD